MSNTTLTAEDALTLARHFREASTALGDYLYAPATWPTLPEKERAALQSLEVTLLNVATDLITQAVGVIIVEAQQSLAELVAATGSATTAIKNIKDVRKVIGITTALIGLAAAIPTGNAGAIFSAFKNVRTSFKD